MSTSLPSSSIRRVTMRDVAELSGVNQASVSVVLNGAKSGGGVSEATRARILQAAEELGYRRNNGAASMKSGRSGWVSLLLCYGESLSSFQNPLMTGISGELAKHGLHLHVEGVPVEALYDESLWPRALREWMSDGVIISYGKQHVPELEAILHRHRIPAIWTNARREADCIYPDDEGAFFSATQKLLELGHQRIAYMVHGHREHYSTKDRRDGYEKAMQSAGLAPRTLQIEDKENPAERYRYIYSAMNVPEAKRPTAVLCYSPGDALNFWSVAQEMGLRVPQDLSLIAADVHETVLQGKKLSSLPVPFDEVGAGAVRSLKKKIENPTYNLPPVAVTFPPMKGETHAPVRT